MASTARKPLVSHCNTGAERKAHRDQEKAARQASGRAMHAKISAAHAAWKAAGMPRWKPR